MRIPKVTGPHSLIHAQRKFAVQLPLRDAAGAQLKPKNSSLP